MGGDARQRIAEKEGTVFHGVLGKTGTGNRHEKPAGIAGTGMNSAFKITDSAFAAGWDKRAAHTFN
jgi:hypothetical protein